MNKSKQQAARLRNPLQRNTKQRTRGTQQSIQDVVAEGARQSVQHFEQVVDDEKLEVVLALDVVVGHAGVEAGEEEEGEGHEQGTKSVVDGACDEGHACG